MVLVERLSAAKEEIQRRAEEDPQRLVAGSSHGKAEALFAFKRSQSTVQEISSWSSARQMCAAALSSTCVEGTLLFFIFVSVMLVVLEADQHNNPAPWMFPANMVVLGVYSVEAAVRIYVFRLKYFYNPMNALDFFLVVSDVVSTIMELSAGENVFLLPALTSLRILRILRFTRTIKFMVKFPQMALLVKGIINALSAVLYGVALVGIVLLFWGVFAVHVLHPVNLRVASNGAYEDTCPTRCERAFESVSASMLTFSQQILAGDSWGQVTIPIMEESPGTTVFFGLVFISINLVLLNVILGVVVDIALKTSEEDHQARLQQKQRDFGAAAEQLKRLCEEMDLDGSGDLTKEELVGGFDVNKEFREILMAMDVKKEDMDTLFCILDADNSGTVHYEEFVTELHKMKTYDNHTLLMFIKHHIEGFRQDWDNQHGVVHGRRHSDDSSQKSHRRHSQQGHNSHHRKAFGDEGFAGSHVMAHSQVNDAGTTKVLSVPIPSLPLSAEPGTRLEEKMKDLEPPSWPSDTSQRHMVEDFRGLRANVCGELVHIMKEISQKSETYARMLDAIVEDPPSRGSFNGEGQASTSSTSGPYGSMADAMGGGMARLVSPGSAVGSRMAGSPSSWRTHRSQAARRAHLVSSAVKELQDRKYAV